MDYKTRGLDNASEPAPTRQAPQPVSAQPPMPHLPPQTPPTTLTPTNARDKEERAWGLACHLSALAGCVVPLGNVLGPLLVWLLKKDEYSFVNDQGKEALNFQLSLLIYTLILFLPSILLFFLPLILLWGAGIVFTIVGAVAANEGRAYRYPFIMRLIQ